MKSWQLAKSAVATALATDQIGVPCAARLVLLAADHGRLETLLSDALASAANWLKSAPTQVTAMGSIQSGHVGVLARFAGGQSVLASAGTAGLGAQRCAVMVVGNHGVLSWEADSAEWSLYGAAGVSDGAADSSARELLPRVREALQAASKNSAAAGVDKPEKIKAPTRLEPPYGLLLVAGDYTHQPNYVPALLAGKRCKLIGLADEAGLNERRQNLNRRLAERLGTPLLPDLDQAFVREDVHVVSICAEPERRGPIIRKALAAGKHLYLDKPLAGSLDEARKIASAAAKGSIVHHMFSLVHADFAQRVREVVRSGKLGEVLAVYLDLHFAKGHTGGAKLGRPRKESAVPTAFELPDSKREMTNIGVYPVVQLLWMLQRPVTRVAAATGNFFFAEHQKNDQEDYGQMLLELEGGVVAGMSVGRTGWKSHTGGGLSRALLVGSKQSTVIDAAQPRIESWSDAALWQPPDRDPDDPMSMWQAVPGSPYIAKPKQAWTIPAEAGPNADAEYFLDCIQQGRASDVPATLAAAATEVLMGAYQSAASGRAVALPLG